MESFIAACHIQFDNAWKRMVEMFQYDIFNVGDTIRVKTQQHRVYKIKSYVSVTDYYILFPQTPHDLVECVTYLDLTTHFIRLESDNLPTGGVLFQEDNPTYVRRLSENEAPAQKHKCNCPWEQIRDRGCVCGGC